MFFAKSSTDALSPDAIADHYGIAKPQMQRLEIYLSLLVKWNKAINLVGPSTLQDPWRRHIADSLQLVRFISESKNHTAISRDDEILDLGAGAGLPGMILAIATGQRVTLVESNQKKANFLTTVSRETQTNVSVVCQRIEAVDPAPYQTIVSRALAPMSTLIEMSRPFISTDSILIFPKGDKVEEELTESAKKWILTYKMHPSDTDPRGQIVVISNVKEAP